MLSDHDLQAKLAEAFHEQADPVAGMGVHAAGVFRQGIRRRRRRIAASAASVVACAALVAGVLIVRAGPEPGPQPPGLLLDAAIARPQPAAAADAGVPPYYVIADHSRPVAEVRAAKTGKILSLVPLPAGIDPKLSQVAAAGNGRGFVLALFSFPRTRFYLLRVAAGGRSARLSSLPVRALAAGKYADAVAVSPDGRNLAVAAVAVSPDGRNLAVAVQSGGGQRGAIEVMTLATGAVTTWTAPRSGWATQLSWARHGRELGFFWQDDRPERVSAAGLWVLNTAAAGHSLMSARRILPASAGGDDVQSAVLSPDGATAIASVTYHGTGHVGLGTVVGGIVELSARTGRPLRTLLALRAAYSADPARPGWYIGQCLLPAADATGRHLLVSCDRFGRLDRARFTALPGAVPQTTVAAAW